MEHSAAIMEDAGKAIDGVAPTSNGAREANEGTVAQEPYSASSQRENNYSRRKRKGDFQDSSMRHGSRGRGGKDGGHFDNKRRKKSDMGRAEYL